MRIHYLILSFCLLFIATVGASAQPDTTTTPLSPTREAHGLIFVSGQLGITNKAKLGSRTRRLSFQQEARNALENVRYVLEEEANLALDDVVNVTVYLADIENYDAFNALYTDYFEAPYPARVVVQVAQLPKDGQVEIAVVAALPEG